MQIIGSMLDFVARNSDYKQLNVWAGGLLGFLEVYLILFILLYVAALFPIESIQSVINQSWVAKGIIHHTPLLSQKIHDLWF